MNRPREHHDDSENSPNRQRSLCRARWIGFYATHSNVLEEELADLPTMGSATRNEIADVSKTYAQKTGNAGGIISGLVETKRTQALVHWVREVKRVIERGDLGRS